MDDVFLRRIPTRCPTCDKLEPCGNNYCATVLVDGERITGRVYNIRDNGWPCVETPQGRVASGPRVAFSSQIDADYERYGSCRHP